MRLNRKRRQSVMRTDAIEAAEEGFPLPPNAESARDLAQQARSLVGSMDSATLEALAQQFLDDGHGPRIEAFVRWARTHAA